MSISICGDLHDVYRMISYMKSYDELCHMDATSRALSSTDSSGSYHSSPVEFDLKTKYYDARLKLNPYECEVIDGVYGIESLIKDLESSECFLDIVPYDKVFCSQSRNSLINAVNVSTKITVRVLISLKRIDDSDLSDEERMSRMLWTLDSGFEHIEVDESNLTEGWKNREKEGLPRLMEALHSNMWSTMIRKQQDKQQDITPTQRQNDIPAVSFDSLSIENSNHQNPVKVKKTHTKTDFNDTEEISDEVDDLLFGQYPDVISKAKEYRDEAMSGTVSDEVRRSRAEAMALALSNILGVDDDDEEDSDDDGN